MASLIVDFMKWKVLHACIGEDNFLGFNRKPHGKLDGQAQGFCLSSDWPDLNNLCRRTGTELKWTSHLNPERSLIVEDPSGVVEARLHHKSIIHLLQPRTSRHTLLSIQSPKYGVLVQSKTPGKFGKTALHGALCIHLLQQCHHQWGHPNCLHKSTSASSSYKIVAFTVVSLHPFTPLHAAWGVWASD